MSASPARTELRYNITSKTTKDDMRRIILTQGQELVNTVERAHQLEVDLQAARATVEAQRQEHAMTKAQLHEAKEENVVLAGKLRQMIARTNRNSVHPTVEDIDRCCAALGVKAVGREELIAWLAKNPR